MKRKRNGFRSKLLMTCTALFVAQLRKAENTRAVTKETIKFTYCSGDEKGVRGICR